MTELSNIRGEFKVQLAGQERTLKASFDAVEQLESGGLSKNIVLTLNDAAVGNVSMRDMTSLFAIGMKAAGDTRLSRQEIGQAIFEAGFSNFIPVFVDYLVYCITGGKPAKGGQQGEA